MVPGTEKKSFFLRPFFGSTPLRSSPKSKIRSHKVNEHILLHICIILLQQGYQGCYNPVPWLLPCQLEAKYKVVTTMFHGCYNLVSWLLQP